MKYYQKLWLVAVLAMLASCADESKLDFQVNKPESMAQLEYLNNYDVLKSYVDRTSNPGFKLGAGASVNDFNKKGLVYSFLLSNFDELTAGYEMKHGAVVQDDGSLNTSNVENFITTAKEAGLSIYGHALCWHANQNAKYLNKTIAPVIIPGSGGPAVEPSVITNSDFEEGTTGWGGWGNGSSRELSAENEGYGDTGFAFTFTNPAVSNFWDAQVAYDFSPALQKGSTYRLNFKVKANSAGTIRAEIQSSSDYSSDGFGTFAISTEWKEYTLEATLTKDDRNRFIISFGDFAGKVYIDDVTVCRLNPDAGGPTLEPSIIATSDFENGDAGWGGWGNNSSRGLSAEGDGNGGSGYAYTFTNPSVTNFWSAQVAYDLSPALQIQSKYVLNFKVKSNTGGTIRAELQSTADYSSDGFGTFAISTDWKEYTLETTATKADRNRFLFSFGDFAGTVYIDDITLRRLNPDGTGEQIIEKTPEEKKQIITTELDRWIKAMMDVSKSYVKAWDVVNEPMDDGKPFELKTGIGKATLAADEFYWQDYLGKDYAVEAFKLAAQYGNSDDKLFINDYNLESNLDKCKGLIAYVEYIEGKGARVDGIGTQMHISINTDKEKIINMFELLAETGKLIKISELDIGIEKQTSEATDEDYKAQAEMYNFVVKKYLEIIPASQQYGITIWSPLDSPSGSSWRAGEPIGLWTEGYSRKRAYGGVADALSGN